MARRRPRLDEAGIDATYGGSYFGEGRDASGDREGRSGYARYDRIASNADIAGWLLWRNFRVANALDVGCATGYLVEVLRERGIDAEGCDVSQFAVDHATPGAAGHIRVANLFAGLPWEDRAFELVTALEILEHLPPDRVATAIPELARVCGGYLYATIPSFGANDSGADGHFEGKVRPERVAHYRATRCRLRGPGARGGPGGRRRRPPGRGPSDHRLVRVVDRAVRGRWSDPSPRHRDGGSTPTSLPPGSRPSGTSTSSRPNGAPAGLAEPRSSRPDPGRARTRPPTARGGERVTERAVGESSRPVSYEDFDHLRFDRTGRPASCS